jgi:hypothetical protein
MEMVTLMRLRVFPDSLASSVGSRVFGPFRKIFSFPVLLRLCVAALWRWFVALHWIPIAALPMRSALVAADCFDVL